MHVISYVAHLCCGVKYILISNILYNTIDFLVDKSARFFFLFFVFALVINIFHRGPY